MSRPAQKKSNVALLTEGQAYIQRAKKARREQVEEVKFDDEARREWLTGFSKRKKAKSDEKRARAKERDKQAHLEARRQARKELKERAAENVKSMRKVMGLVDDEEVEAGAEDGQEAGPSKPKLVEAEYSDEDQLATVTIIEDFDPSSITILPTDNDDEDDDDDEHVKAKAEAINAEREKARLKDILPPSSGKLAKLQQKKKEKAQEKARSRSMETNSERKKGREMEARRRTKKASLAMERHGRQRGVKGSASGGGRGKGAGGARGKGRGRK